MCQSLYDSICVVVRFDVVHANESWDVFLAEQIPCRLFLLVQRLDFFQSELGVDHNLDIFQAVAIHLISFRQNINLLRLHVDVHMVSNLQRVEVRWRLVASSTKVFATHKTSVHIDVAQCHRAELFEVKVSPRALDRVQVKIAISFGGLSLSRAGYWLIQIFVVQVIWPCGILAGAIVCG